MSEIVHGDCLEVMRGYPDNHFTGIVCDPPYGLGFMGKKWDVGLPHNEIWQEALRIIKPGGHLLAFGGTRTYHRLTCAIEDAGWEIRDCVMWLYGSGFPKSNNRFGLEGYGTALKPAHEPCMLAMKPIDGTYAQNVEKWGVGGINIDACRVGMTGGTKKSSYPKGKAVRSFGNNINGNCGETQLNKGRWPANLILNEEAGAQLDEQSGILKTGGENRENKTQNGGYGGGFKPMYNYIAASLGGASRFFYCAKASSSERNEGCENISPRNLAESNKWIDCDYRKGTGEVTAKKQSNNHPTVKPLSLMRYLITLIAPPTNALILDPFAGSGSTVVAAHQLGIRAIGIEKEAEYVEIARARLKHVEKQSGEDLFGHTH